jgi:hypothetical protein
MIAIDLPIAGKQKMQVTEHEELRNIVEVINMFHIHGLNGPEQFYNAASAWFRSKLENYQGAERLSQFERNFVYFAEATGCSIAYAMNVLKTGEPDVTEDKVDKFIEYVGKALPQQHIEPILNFLHGSSDSLQCRPFAKVDWRQIRKLRATASIQEYFTYVASESVPFYMATILADMHLQVYLLDPRLKESCSMLSNGIISDTLYGQIMKSCRAMAYFFPATINDE